MPDSPVQPVSLLRLPSGEVFLYPGQAYRLGRSPECEVILKDLNISRVHALLEWNGTGFTISDLGSVNGTYVNSARLGSSPRQLRDGDEISLSRVEIVYELLREGGVPAALQTLPAAPTGRRFQGTCLVVTAGPDTGQEYPVWGDTLTIGRNSRDATWEIRLTDRAVSRPHARLERVENGFLLSDLESANGTYLNGKLITGPQAVQSGDLIELGETGLVITIQAEGGQTGQS